MPKVNGRGLVRQLALGELRVVVPLAESVQGSNGLYGHDSYEHLADAKCIARTHRDPASSS